VVRKATDVLGSETMANAQDRQGQPKRTDKARPPDAVHLSPFALGPDRPVDTQVYEHLRRTLASGAVAPGQKLSTRTLATAFGLSATPIRVALKQLVGEGVLVGRPRSGFQVAPATAAAYRELIAIRCRLEGLAAREAATSMSASELRELERLHRRIAAKTHAEATYLELNFAFHFTIYRAAGMPRLLDIIEPLWARIGPYLHLAAGFQMQDQFVTSHQAILAALQRHDGEAAETALRLDLESAAAMILPRLV